MKKLPMARKVPTPSTFQWLSAGVEIPKINPPSFQEENFRVFVFNVSRQ